MKTIALIILISSGMTAAGHLAAITEVLKDPLGGANSLNGDLGREFIEFTNLGSSEIPIDSLYLSDGVIRQKVIAWGAGSLGTVHPACRYGAMTVNSGEIALILDKEYQRFVDSLPSAAFAIADSTVLLTVNESSLIGGITANDGLFLYVGTATVIGYVVAAFMDEGQNADVSGLKIIQTSPAEIVEGTSIVASSLLFGLNEYQACPTGISPGRCEFFNNGWVVDRRAVLSVGSDSAIACTLAVCKPGVMASAIYRIDRTDGLASGITLNARVPDTNGILFLEGRLPLDSVQYSFVIDDNGLIISIPLDLSSIWSPAFAIKITEIFPRATTAIPEWFEVINTSSLPINLAGWIIGNEESEDTLGSGMLMAGPGEYVILTSNKTLFNAAYRVLNKVFQPAHWHTLGNFSDSLLLTDNHGNRRETVYYDSKWFSNWGNQSLARINLSRSAVTESSWVVAAHASPGQPNTDVLWRTAAAPSIDIGPIPFTPNGDGRDDLLSIKVALPPASALRMTMYGFDGVVLKTFTGAPMEQYLWNGRTDRGAAAPVGPFFIVAEISSPSGVKMIRKKGVLWR